MAPDSDRWWGHNRARASQVHAAMSANSRNHQLAMAFCAGAPSGTHVGLHAYVCPQLARGLRQRAHQLRIEWLQWPLLFTRLLSDLRASTSQSLCQFDHMHAKQTGTLNPKSKIFWEGGRGFRSEPAQRRRNDI